jgi:pimeloyl-ACP methyl ester carboxylesterase
VRSILLLVVFVVAELLAPLAPAQSSVEPLGLEVKPCTEGHLRVAALCGTFGAYENRALHSGRVIALHFVVLKAERPTHRAIVMVAGGPGQGAASFAAPVADGMFERGIAALRQSYNILFVDGRGMGESNPLQCDLAPASDPSSYFMSLLPDGLLAACRGQLSKTSHVSMYNTNAAVDDLNDVRAALGYTKLVLNGGSYGTFFSLVYMRRHPQH